MPTPDRFVRRDLTRTVFAVLLIEALIGGSVPFGIVGLFVGPVLPAISHTLLKEWAAEGRRPREGERPRGEGE